jgi:hypothetical protein
MTTEDIERVNYYERQYLQAADFRAEQDYHRDMRRRHNLAHHTWGIVTGLELVEQDNAGSVSVFVQPGMAVDGYGREIVLLAPYLLDAALFERFNTLAHRQVWLSYDQTDALPPGYGFESCEDTSAMRRIVEGFRIVVDPGPVTHDPVIIDGQPAPGAFTVPADESVPYQEFPDETVTDPLWLIRLGTVQWDGPNQAFVNAAAGRLNEARSYVGAVAASVLAPADALTITPRTPPADPDAGDFAEVVGRLAVDGRLTARADVHVDGGLVRLNYTGGDTDSVDLWLGRRRGPSDVGHLIRVHLGDAADAANQLTIGPSEQSVLAVRADDVVQVPTGTLSFGTQTRQMLGLWAAGGTAAKEAEYGIGVQSGTLYQRAATQFAWFRGGKHDDAANTPGDGGSLQMRLDSQARLLFDSAAARQVLNLQGSAWGVGTQPSTLYLRSPGGFAFFRGGLESPADADPGGGGALAMRLTSGGDLDVFGELRATGDVIAGHNGDAEVRTRHVRGKSGVSDADDDLFLNWGSGRDVYVGQPGGNSSDLLVAGDLKIFGADDSAFRVRSYTQQLANDGAGGDGHTPRPWTISLGADFGRIFTAFAVLNGFSLWNNDGNPAFDVFDHLQSTAIIPQHCYVRVTGWTTTQVFGECFCQQSDAAQEANNTVFFTLVVVGRRS